MQTFIIIAFIGAAVSFLFALMLYISYFKDMRKERKNNNTRNF